MSLQKLLQGIESEAQAEAERILQQARSETWRIVQEAQKNAQLESRQWIDQKIAASQKEAAQKISQARLESRKRILGAQKAVIDQVFDQALQRLGNLDNDHYREWLKKQIVNASETGEETIKVNQQDKARLSNGWLGEVNELLQQKGLAGKLRLEFEDTGFSGGFVLQHPQYEVVVSFNEILNSLKESMQSQIAQLLVGEHSDKNGQAKP
jgi:V/A-type H+-transporting ATPase subunit E